MEKIKSEKHGWWIYENKAVRPTHHWENPESNGGLLLSTCPTCKTKQTRETYCKGFTNNFYTLIQDYEVTGIAQCSNCGQWLQIHG